MDDDFDKPLELSNNSSIVDEKRKIGQEQLHDLLFGETLSWQAIIYDLINTEQLDPWDVDISILAQRFLERIRELEEANFFISSKVLLAASLLLRIKSELLLNHYLKSLDDILFGRKEDKKYIQERIELEDEIPDLIPRTPLPRYKKVTLQELMLALGNAIKTESRRIRRVVVKKQQEIETAISLPKKSINLKDRIQEVYGLLKNLFEKNETKFAFSELSGKSSQEKLSFFVPLLHLDNNHKVFLEQEKHLDEIWIWMKHHYDKENAEWLEKMKKEVEEEIKNSPIVMSDEELNRAEELETDFEEV